MAVRPVVLNDALCFIACKFGKTTLKTLKSAVMDFYDVNVVADVKRQLIYDIDAMNLTTNRPHVPSRRDGDLRLSREVDDIVSLFTFIDEQKSLTLLPTYASSRPDNMPSIRLYEGELSILVSLIRGMEGRLGAMESALSAISGDMRKLEVWPSLPEPATRLQSSASRLAEPAVSSRDTQLRLSVSEPPILVNTSACTSMGFPTLSASASASVKSANRFVNSRTDWSVLASSPIIQANRFGVLSSDDVDDDNDEYSVPSTVVRRNNKRSRRVTSPPQQSSQQHQQQTDADRRRTTTVFGKSTTTSTKLTAAGKICKKAVFFASIMSATAVQLKT